MLCNLRLRIVEPLNLLITPLGYWGSFPAKTRVLSLHHIVEALSGASPVATDVARREADHSSIHLPKLRIRGAVPPLSKVL